MVLVSVIVIVVTAVLNAVSAVVDFAGGRYVVGNAEANGVAREWLPVLGGLKAAGAVGLLAAVLGVPVIGAWAAAGLVLFFVGAVVAHVRAGTWSTIAAPGVFLALAAGSLWFTLTA
ncbi:DoxX family protein [Saccharopolyspora sp. ID03-671]|uniref:DoxX family protein n=1 Tax=Saccharopolyspora sp. ID03-671 TaxID=3073066 RepID=UPI003243471D